MLLLREYRTEDINKIYDILSKEDIRDKVLDGLIYVAIDDGELVGVARAREKDNICSLQYLIIREDKRNQRLGDALLRAMLNKLLNLGIEHIYYKKYNGYLTRKGFFVKGDEELGLNIIDFFQRLCCGCGGHDEF